MQDFAAQLLRTADPSVRLDGIPAADIQREAQALAQFAVEKLRSDAITAPADVVQLLNDRQLTQYASRLRAANDYGKWTQSIGGDGASYFPAQNNPHAIGDIKCENCVHWQDGRCEIVSGAIDPQGVCKLWIIPDSVLSPFEESLPYAIYDSVRMDGRVIRWGGLDIGITHQPGDQRFPGSNPMRAYYGRIYRSWGNAEDGKAIDAYISPSFNPESDNNPIYRVIQRDPASGMTDERKYFFGYSSPEDVKRAHIYHAGMERFGSIEQVDPGELDAYRKDAIYHTDSCGCQACAAKANTPRRKRKRKAKPEEIEESGIEPERTDAVETDESSFLAEKAQQQAKSAITQWVKSIATWLKSSESLEFVKQVLSDDPVQAYKLLDGKKFENSVYQATLLADLMGRSQVLEEDRIDSLSDELPIRNDAPRPDWLNLSFREAIASFRKRIVIPADDYKTMQEGYHDWAFSVSQMARADFLEDAKWLIDQAITEGNSFETFQRQWARAIGRKGWNPGEHRLYTIFDTNIRSANGTGRGKQMQDPEVASRRPFILWRWRDSPNPRVNHQKLDGKAIPLSSPFWQKCRTPAGFGCRCLAASVTKDYCDRHNIEILNNPPDPETIAEPGFRYPLAGLDEQQRQEQIDEMRGRLDLKLRSYLEKEQRS